MHDDQQDKDEENEDEDEVYKDEEEEEARTYQEESRSQGKEPHGWVFTGALEKSQVLVFSYASLPVQIL